MVDENKNILKNKQTKGLKRNTIDKFYTKDTIVNQCIDIIKKNNTIENTDLIIEPSAGNGAFIKDIKNLSNNFKFYDIDPEHKEIIKQDFLELENPTSDNKIHIIGNPPFGRQSSMAIKFIKKSCEFANTISFILPKSFKKDSLQKHFDKYFHLINEIDLADNSFLINNEETNVPCVFQIWEKKEEVREELTILEPINFIFVKKEDNPDIAFRRVGVNAGTITRYIADSSIQSHYFIKFTNNKGLNDNIKKIKNITYEFNNTVGPKSISKQELITRFNPLLV
jgi:predicted RNA methylase